MVVKGEETQVVRLLLAPRQRAGYAAARRQCAYGVGNLEQQRIAALPERGDQDQIARLRLRQRVRQHHQRMRCAGIAADGGEIVAHRGFRNTGAFGQCGQHARQRARQAEVRDRGRCDAARFEQRRERRRHDFQVALVADPALFPGIVVGALAGTELVHEIHGLAMRSDQARDRLAAPDH